jgi:hypothetical protein
MKTLLLSASLVIASLSPQISARDFQLTLGATTTGTIPEPGAFDRYRFTGAAGQRLIYDAVDADGDQIVARLMAPSGATVHINGNSDTDIGRSQKPGLIL